MLNLFQAEELPVEKEEVLRRARSILLSYLNKGMIPTWEHFFTELPIFSRAQDLSEVKANFTLLTHWTFLQDILSIPGTEYFFHGVENSQVLNLKGEKISCTVPLDEQDWQLWLEILSIHFKQNWNVEKPFASFYGSLFDRTYRITLVHGSTSPTGQSKLVLRSLAAAPHALSSFGSTEILESIIKNKKNTLIAGSTGSGKTSLLSSLLEYVEKDEHIAILEDTYEIQSSHPHQTRFLAGESAQNSLKSYLTYTLRLSPDRIVLGEMRSHEVVPFLMAMNTGHKGLMGTLHASSGVDALHRVVLLFSLYAGEANLSFDRIMELLCRNLEYVVFMENKRVKEVIKILGSDKGVAFFETIIGGSPENFF
ncbi:MAG TPA: CpaF/VirB11 family protein [Bacteriovoracaceae bacterium]|nr:CpaF/VirB11 family protein [Bacteriovoracaceae bacterium]